MHRPARPFRDPARVAAELQVAEHELLLVLPGTEEHARLVRRIGDLTDELLEPRGRDDAPFPPLDRPAG